MSSSADGGHSRAQSPSSLATSRFKYYHPYFTPEDTSILTLFRRGKFSVSHDDKIRQNACSLLEVLGARIGFPRRTIATAQALYHRFHLYFSKKDFNYFDVCLAALYVSTKMHDTLKKPRELMAVSYAVRFPELAAKSKHPGGEIDLDSMDPQVVENDRQRLLAIERLILETICFNFKCRLPFSYVIKIGRELAATKLLTKLAWRLVMDCYRTHLPLEFPPHTLALGGLFVASLLTCFEQAPSDTPEWSAAQDISQKLRKKGDWEGKFQSQVADMQEIAHRLLDLMIQFAQNPSASTSPSTPSSPSPHLSRHPANPPHVTQAQIPYDADQLLRLKIAIREGEYPPRERAPTDDTLISFSPSNLGNNEGTMRFLFAPPGT